MASDQAFMQQALLLAEMAEQHNEVPVGAVVVYDNKIIGEGFNQSIRLHDPSAHAEIMAMRQAAANIGNYRLIDCTLYVTLEPCVMCLGALIHARIKRLVFAAHDPKSGAIESCFKMIHSNAFNHRIEYESGLLKEQSSAVLKNFFQKRRNKIHG